MLILQQLKLYVWSLFHIWLGYFDDSLLQNVDIYTVL